MTDADPVLRYATPANRWTDALPIGNGRLGAMLYGTPDRDRWQLNDDTCWSGWPGSSAGEPASAEPSPAVIERVRGALLAGDVATAEREIRKVQYGRSQAYQPLAELAVTTTRGTAGELRRRQLDLAEAVASWTATGGEAEVFASAPARAVVGRYRWSAPVDVTVAVTAAHADYGRATVRAEESAVILTSRMPSLVYPRHDRTEDAVHYDDTPGRAVTAALVVRVITDGTVRGDGPALVITGATELRLLLVTETDYAGPLVEPHGEVAVLVDRAVDRVARLADHDHDQLRAEHVAEYRSWFDRFALELADDGPAAADTDELLQRSREGDVTPRLAELLVAYGRYLLISASRPGTLPANLQGIWNASVQPPWSSNYTVNINTEMNYWPALPTGLAECAEPLYALVEAMAVTGAETARRVYDRPGWAAHHNADAWAYTLPVGEGNANPCWAAWPMAGFWLLRHFWDHYEFTGDRRFWVDRAWPLLDGAVAFGLATLCELPGGELGTVPSTSPENSYRTGDGGTAAVTISATMDLALLRDTFRIWQDAAAAVRAEGGAVDQDRAAAVADALARLPRPEPTARGSYPEWRADLPEAEPTHRHQSHLYDLFPGEAINPYDPAEAERLAAAAETLRLRGPYSTGWSLAWRIALQARLHDVAAATRSLELFLTPVPEEVDRDRAGGEAGGVYRNLFCAHPPFQIDGNYGAVAGVVEMLLQSHGRIDGRRVIDLLPCLPERWTDGRLRGARARGGLTVDLTWAAGRVSTVTVTAAEATGPQRLLLRRPGEVDLPLDLAPGERWTSAT